MPRLRDRQVLNAGLTGPQLLWEQEGFALADGYDEATGKYRGARPPDRRLTVTITDATLIVRPGRAKAQRAAEVADRRVMPGEDAAPGPGSGTRSRSGPDTPPTPGKTRYFGSKRLQADRYAIGLQEAGRRGTRAARSHTRRDLNVTIEIEATPPDGFDDAKVRTVSENATTLKFEQSGFEDG